MLTDFAEALALYLLTCRLLGCLMVPARHEVCPKTPSSWLRRRETAVLRRQIGRVCYTPADRLWLSALSRLIARQGWAEVLLAGVGFEPT